MRIKLTEDEEEKKDPGRAYLHKDGWLEVKPSDIRRITLGELMDGEYRLMMEVPVEDRKIYLVSWESDEKSLRRKYPQASVINIQQLLNLFSKHLTDDQVGRHVPKVLLAMSIFPGSKIVS